jgi:hypothetical protein
MYRLRINRGPRLDSNRRHGYLDGAYKRAGGDWQWRCAPSDTRLNGRPLFRFSFRSREMKTGSRFRCYPFVSAGFLHHARYAAGTHPY